MAGNKKVKFALNGKNIVILILLIAIVVGYYISTSNTSQVSQDIEEEYTLLKEKDLGISYPETPKEVVKLYSRIVKCLYKDELSEEEEKALVQQMRLLFDNELLENNSIEQQIEKLDNEVKTFTSTKTTIINYEVDESSLETKVVDDTEYATIVVGFSINKKKEYTRTDELFLLKKDAEGQWKIVGWQLADDETEETA